MFSSVVVPMLVHAEIPFLNWLVEVIPELFSNHESLDHRRNLLQRK